MYEIDNVLVSDAIAKVNFVCDLKRCKGWCCVDGDAGAPLEPDEIEILKKEIDQIKPFLTTKGQQAIEAQGVYVEDTDGDDVTPLVEGKECAYTIFLEDGTASCGIEKAYQQGRTSLWKPISCHLYPIRLGKLRSGQETVNYHEWNICTPACTLGQQLQVPIYKFVKDALIRRYGTEWYEMLSAAIDQIRPWEDDD